MRDILCGLESARKFIEEVFPSNRYNGTRTIPCDKCSDCEAQVSGKPGGLMLDIPGVSPAEYFRKLGYDLQGRSTMYRSLAWRWVRTLGVSLDVYFNRANAPPFFEQYVSTLVNADVARLMPIMDKVYNFHLLDKVN